MATAILSIKLMPDSPSSDLNAIKAEASALLAKEGAKNLSIEEKPIAFGLKAIYLRFDFPEEKGSDMIESLLAKIPQVSSVTIEEYKRAFG